MPGCDGRGWLRWFGRDTIPVCSIQFALLIQEARVCSSTAGC